MSKDDEEKLPAQEQRWHVCCSETEPAFVKFIAQLMVTAAVLALSIYKLVQADTDVTLYTSLLTLILGVYVDTPRHSQ